MCWQKPKVRAAPEESNRRPSGCVQCGFLVKAFSSIPSGRFLQTEEFLADSYDATEPKPSHKQRSRQKFLKPNAHTVAIGRWRAISEPLWIEPSPRNRLVLARALSSIQNQLS